ASTTTVPATTTTTGPATTTTTVAGTTTTTRPTVTTATIPATTTTTIATTTTTVPATTSTTIATTTTTSSTTTTTAPAAVCGNGTIEPSETCDDGNTVDESTTDTIPPDTCPATCRIQSCSSTSGTVSVSVNFSSPSSVAGYKIFVDYPENEVVIPGTGQPAAGVITNDPTASATANDLDYGLIVVAGGLNAIRPSRLFTINFTP